MGFHLRLRPEDAAALLAACERAATSAQASHDQQRASQAAKDAATAQRRQAVAQGEAGTESFVVLPPDAGPLIADGVDYTSPNGVDQPRQVQPDPWLDGADGERVTRDEPGWRVVGRARLTRTGAVR